jgi:hypothetical protein
MTAAQGRSAAEPIAVRVRDAGRITGLSRSRLYELMRSGDNEFVKIGASTPIPYDGLSSFIERRRDCAT